MTKKLLIVDDSQVSRQVIRNIVTRYRRDWSIFESDNGYDAVEMIDLVSPDFVTMDVNMPQMSGLEAAQKILEKAPHVRVLVLTANVQEAVRKRSDELEVGFIEKPISDQTIIRAIDFFEAAGSDHAL